MDTPSGSNIPDILHYQRDRRLDDVVGLSVGLQLQHRRGGRVYLGLSATDIGLYFDGEFVLHYDLEGRLTKIAHVSEYWRRGLSNRVLYARKPQPEAGGGLLRQLLGRTEADAAIARAHDWVQLVREDLKSGRAIIEFGKPDVETARRRLEPVLERAAFFDVKAAHASGERFREIYGRVAVLPSDQYNALVLQVTSGCGFGACLFCDLYDGVRYQVKTLEEFQRHVNEAVAFHGEGLRTKRMIYLGEANALHAPQELLVKQLGYLNEVFELASPEAKHVPASWWMGSPKRLEGIASFLDVFTSEPRTVAEFAELRRWGLKRVYIGMESGSDALLQWLRKPAWQTVMQETVRRLKEAEIQVGVIILLGAGGVKFSEEHVKETIASINAMPLGKGDYVYFSPLVIHPGGAYEERIRKSCDQCLTEAQMKEQAQAIQAGLKFDEKRGRPYLAHYELDAFIY